MTNEIKDTEKYKQGYQEGLRKGLMEGYGKGFAAGRESVARECDNCRKYYEGFADGYAEYERMLKGLPKEIERYDEHDF